LLDHPACDPNPLIFGKYLLIIFGIISRFINSNLKNWESLGGAPFKISDQNLGLPGLPTMGRTESSKTNPKIDHADYMI
jgi:hypothetical protein